MSFVEVFPSLLSSDSPSSSAASLKSTPTAEGDYVCWLEDEAMNEPNHHHQDINAMFYEKMFQAMKHQDEAEMRCSGGSFNINSQLTLIWKTFGNDLILQEADLYGERSSRTFTFKAPMNVFFLPGVSLMKTHQEITMWALATNRTLYRISLTYQYNKSNTETENKQNNSLIDALVAHLHHNIPIVEVLRIGMATEEIEFAYNRANQKSIFTGFFGGGSSESNNIDFFNNHSQHFPTCLYGIEHNAAIIGFANGDLLRVMKEGNNSTQMNRFIFENTSTTSWPWFSSRNKDMTLMGVFKNGVVSVKHISMFNNQLDLIISLHRNGYLIVWREDVETKVMATEEIDPVQNHLRLLTLNIPREQSNEDTIYESDLIDSLRFCSDPMKVIPSTVTTPQQTSSSFNIVLAYSRLNGKTSSAASITAPVTDETLFTALSFGTTVDQQEQFSLEYRGIENVKYFSSELLQKDLFQFYGNSSIASRLVTFDIADGNVWAIWSVRDFSFRNVIEGGYSSFLSYTASYGSILSSAVQTQSAWSFVRTLHSQYASGILKISKVNDHVENVRGFVMQFLFESSIRNMLNPNVLLRAVVSFYPKDELPTLAQSLGVSEDYNEILSSQLDHVFWMERITYAIEYTLSQKRAMIDDANPLQRNQMEAKMEAQTWKEFLHTLIQVWITFNSPLAFAWFDTKPQQTPGIIYTGTFKSAPSVSMLRSMDTLENIFHNVNQQNCNRNYVLVADQIHLTKEITSKLSFSKDLIRLFEVLNYVETSVTELSKSFNILPYYFSKKLGLEHEDPSVTARVIALELVSGLTFPDANELPDTLIQDSKINSKRKLFVHEFLKRLNKITSTPIYAILNYISRKLMGLESISLDSISASTKECRASPRSANFISLINGASMQLLESRFYLCCQLCVFVEVMKLLTPNDSSITHSIALADSLESKSYYTALRGYHIAWWLSTRSIEANFGTLNLAKSLSDSKLNLTDYMLSYPTLHNSKNHAFVLEMLLRESRISSDMISLLDQLSSQNLSLSRLVTNIASNFVHSNILVEYDGINPHANDLEICQYLINWQAFETLKEYASILQSYDASFPHSFHFLGIANLQQGEALQTKENFVKCAIIAINNRSKQEETKRLFELMNIYWKVEPSIVNSKTSQDLVKQSVSFYYYNYVRQLCGKHPELALDFTNLALMEADSEVVPQEEVNILYSVLFTLSLHFDRYDDAYIAINCQTDVQRKKADLRKFVGTIGELAAVNATQCAYYGNMLCELPFSGMRNEVNDLLHERAMHADLSIRMSETAPNYYGSLSSVKVLHPSNTSSVLSQSKLTLLEEHQERINSTYAYYHLLYAFNVHRGDYNKAALYMYELGRRIDSQVKLIPMSVSSDAAYEEIIEAYLKKQAECFLISLNALKLVSDRNQWFLYPFPDDSIEAIDRSISPLKRNRDSQSTAIENEDLEKRPHPGIITISQLETRYHMASSKVTILQCQRKNPTTTFNVLSLLLLNKPLDVITLLASENCEEYEKAFYVATCCKLPPSDLHEIFTRLARKCYHSEQQQPFISKSSTEKLWQLLRLKLKKHDSAATNYQLSAACVKTIYKEIQLFDNNTQKQSREPSDGKRNNDGIPLWLLDMCEPNTLLRIYLEFGKRKDAHELLQLNSAFPPNAETPNRLKIPITYTMREYASNF
ncbi:hypothetical protein C9374_009989 [Naegleria lovaniensis]|uniref:NUP160 middle TPR domain-containing protein n=1 Tax=Naegleria lovaniensis TaxID=51637 RepID=A0AA88KGZ8_NAELO|nr:uncharacterized protein C9374_009989 [Naegleria lovaniensis]KAG2375366.1 hypothetical protein C9374_009989 [Naegleria lovaniensis]